MIDLDAKLRDERGLDLRHDAPKVLACIRNLALIALPTLRWMGPVHMVSPS
jgi:hypothetical protein